MVYLFWTFIVNNYNTFNLMAKTTLGGKVTFGKKKNGKAKKSFNKHTPRPKAYVGQGR